MSDNKKAMKKGFKGGNQSRGRRVERRTDAPSQAKAITSQLETKLGLTSPSGLISHKVEFSYRPSIHHLNLLGSNVFVSLMLNRIRHIAPRPLAILLAEEGVVPAYRKVCCYLYTARVVSAQEKTPYVAGHELSLRGAIAPSELKSLDARTSILPTSLAWSFSQIGSFATEFGTSVPLLPNPAAAAVTIADVMTGNFYAVCRYVYRHAVRAGGVAIPVAERPLVQRLAAALPLEVNNRHFFTVATLNLWNRAIDPYEWECFESVNASLNELHCTVHDFNVTDAVGSTACKVRHVTFDAPDILSKYYATVGVTEEDVKTAIALRLGVDEFLPVANRRNIYVGEHRTGLVQGYDKPIAFINAQLELMKREAQH